MKCRFKKDYCHECGKSISSRFKCNELPTLAIHVFVDKKGIIETMSPNHKSKRRKDAKYLGYTLDKHYPKTLNTGRVLYKKLS